MNYIGRFQYSTKAGLNAVNVHFLQKCRKCALICLFSTQYPKISGYPNNIYNIIIYIGNVTSYNTFFAYCLESNV